MRHTYTKLLISLVSHSSLHVTDLLCRSGGRSEWSPSHFWSWSGRQEPLGRNYMEKNKTRRWVQTVKTWKRKGGTSLMCLTGFMAEEHFGVLDSFGCRVMLTEVSWVCPSWLEDQMKEEDWECARLSDPPELNLPEGCSQFVNNALRLRVLGYCFELH